MPLLLIDGIVHYLYSCNCNVPACILLERMMCEDILFFACRHHIAEIILSTVFKNFMPSSGLDIPLFKRFKEYCQKIETNDYMQMVWRI